MRWTARYSRTAMAASKGQSLRQSDTSDTYIRTLGIAPTVELDILTILHHTHD